MGEYRLVEELSSYQVHPVRWISMTTKVMCINIKDFERTPYDKLNFIIFTERMCSHKCSST